MSALYNSTLLPAAATTLLPSEIVYDDDQATFFEDLRQRLCLPGEIVISLIGVFAPSLTGIWSVQIVFEFMQQLK